MADDVLVFGLGIDPEELVLEALVRGYLVLQLIDENAFPGSVVDFLDFVDHERGFRHSSYSAAPTGKLSCVEYVMMTVPQAMDSIVVGCSYARLLGPVRPRMEGREGVEEGVVLDEGRSRSPFKRWANGVDVGGVGYLVSGGTFLNGQAMSFG